MTDDGIGGSGYTLEQLSEYLDSGRTPAIEAIDDNAECQAVLTSLERYGSLSRELVSRDAAEAPALDESWFSGLFASITREVKAGRDIPLASTDPLTRLTITEGAIRGLVRSAGDSVDGVLVGRCSLEGETDVTVAVSISVLLGTPVRAAAESVRQAVYTALLKHTELSIAAVDVTVEDVHVIATEGGES
ncbi:Asp23/Gls24 family envelope stress response protein [Glaciihabitans arcticus]|uniref:Asp23/Gls24 family envelope stress response protein n=1 Tax=Glaciihabitans arcticus TaxID=2668039 RepID=A0A4Q9GU05_9MICO|nr:Asp23/Gls24 family envelope stress response protein [Glaciihabitans arcticus]TBN58195.1 Asp23/Gls24 family envelope stress response protein [Glaciihabitans arcticus]